MSSTAPTGRKVSRTQAARTDEPHHRVVSFSVKGCNGGAKSLTRGWWKALDKALPEFAGQGVYWRDQIINHGAVYPPRQTKTPPRTCQCIGDRGRLYPANYLATCYPKSERRRDPKNPARLLPAEPRPGYRICADCIEARRAPRDRSEQHAHPDDPQCHERIFMDRDGAIWRQAWPAPEPAETPPEPSAFTEAMQAMAASGTAIAELPLMTEDARVLARQIARHESGEMPFPTE